MGNSTIGNRLQAMANNSMLSQQGLPRMPFIPGHAYQGNYGGHSDFANPFGYNQGVPLPCVVGMHGRFPSYNFTKAIQGTYPMGVGFHVYPTGWGQW